MEFNFSDSYTFGQSDFFKIENTENENILNKEIKEEITSSVKSTNNYEEIIDKFLANKDIPTKIFPENENRPNFIDVYNQLHLSKSREWTAHEDNTLLEYVAKYNSRNWKRISEIIKTKTPQQCTYRYQKLIKEKDTQKWSRKEDIKLYELIETYGEDFETIVKYFEGRTAKQLEERYRKKLDPKSRNTTFTKQEDILLYNLHKKLGNKWVNISKHFADKKPDIIKQRYFNFIKKNFCKDGDKILYPNENERKDTNEVENATVNIDQYDDFVNEAIYEETKREFEQVFKSKMISNNEPSLFEFDYRTFKKSDTVSTQEISVKNDFNVDSFFEDSSNSIKIQQMYNSIILNNQQEQNQDFSSNNYLIQIHLYQEQLEKLVKFYNSKEHDLMVFLESLPSNSFKEKLVNFNTQLNAMKERCLNDMISKSHYDSTSTLISQNKQTTFLLTLKDIFRQISHLTKLKLELFQ